VTSAPPGGEARLPWLARSGPPVVFLILILALIGAYLAWTIPIAVFPTTNFPRIVIGVDNGVAPIDQMLVTVTRPIEDAVNSVPGLERVRSVTSRGSVEVDLSFAWSVDMLQTLQRVNAALSRVQPTLPPHAEVQAHRLTFATFPILGYSLTSDTVPQTRLWEIATYDLKPRLNRLDGVSTVVIQGGEEPEFLITPDPAKLLTASVTVQDLLDAVRRTNVIDSPGLMESDHQLLLGLVSGQVQTPEQLAQVVVKSTPSGVPVRVGDVATVAPSVRPVYTRVRANGKPAVLLNVNRQPDSNLMAVAGRVHAEVERLRRSLPPGADLEPFYDQSVIVGQSITSVRDAIVLGLILGSIVLVVFLRDWRTSVIAGLVVPLSLLITLIALKLLGASFNLMTLGGLAAAVGLVIDNAIIVVEGIVFHRDAGRPRLEAIRRAVRDLAVPLVGSTVTPVVVFLPLVAITGVTGTFFQALALTMTVTLLTSLVLAVTWIPVLSHLVLRDRPATAGSAAGAPETRGESMSAADRVEAALAEESHAPGGVLGRAIHLYERWLRRAIGRPWWLCGFSVALIIVSFLSYRTLGSDLLPEMDEGGFVLDYIMPAGSSLAETDRVVTHVEQMVKGIPEVASTSRRTGLQLGLAAVTEANTGDISVKLKARRRRGVEEIIEQVRRMVERQEPALQVEFTQLLQDMIGDLTSAPEPIELKLFASDPELLREWSPRVAGAIRKIPGVVDVLDGIDNTISGPAVLFQVDPTVAARAGFTPEEVATDAGAILQGETAPTPVVVNDRAYTIRVRFPDENRSTLEAMQDTLLVSEAGRTATLGALATVARLPGQTEIRRENLLRDVVVTARLEGVDLGRAIARVRRAVTDLHLPPSIRVEYGGTYQEQQRSFHDLVVVLVAAVVLVFAVLLFEFGSWPAPTAIVAAALLSTSGVVFALMITGTTFNIASFMGLIMVVGIVAKNGILLLDAEAKFRGLGLASEEAVIRAGRRRLRPILMTALATVAGMLPLALAWGAGSQMLQPLAIAVIGGVLVSMALSLIITPAVHVYLTRGAGSDSSRRSGPR
jgi:multidrug efflux pump subunit AcrB